MGLVVVTVVSGLLLGLARGGRVPHLAALTLRWPWLAGVAVALQLALAPAPAGATPGLLIASQAALLAFLIANRRTPGVWLIAAGIAANALVIDVNGGMPVDPAAIEVLGGPQAVTEAVAAGKHRLLADGDRLTFLADLLPVPPLAAVISVGDILLVAGGVWLIAEGMRGRREDLEEAPEPAPGG